MDLAIPDPWTAIVLALGAYRLTRFLGWDDWPPIYRVRAWATGERWIPEALADPPQWPPPTAGSAEGERMVPSASGGSRPARGPLNYGEIPLAETSLPGKTPESEVSDVRPAYDRPTLAHLVHCPWCLGAWVSLGVYAWWVCLPSLALFLLFPAAISASVGLIARNLDP